MFGKIVKMTHENCTYSTIFILRLMASKHLILFWPILNRQLENMVTHGHIVVLTDVAETVLRKTATATKIPSFAIVTKLSTWLIVSQTFITEPPPLNTRPLCSLLFSLLHNII